MSPPIGLVTGPEGSCVACAADKSTRDKGLIFLHGYIAHAIRGALKLCPEHERYAEGALAQVEGAIVDALGEAVEAQGPGPKAN